MCTTQCTIVQCELQCELQCVLQCVLQCLQQCGQQCILKVSQGKSTAVHINQNLDNSERDLSELVLKSLHQTKLNLSN